MGVLPFKHGSQPYPARISDRRFPRVGLFASPPPNHQSPVPLHPLEGVEGDVLVSFEGEVVVGFEGEVVVGFEGNGERGRGGYGEGRRTRCHNHFLKSLSRICDHLGFEGDGGRWGTPAEAQRLLQECGGSIKVNNNLKTPLQPCPEGSRRQSRTGLATKVKGWT